MTINKGLGPKLKLCLFHLTRPTDPRKYPRPENFYSYFVLKIFFFCLFRPKIIVFDVLLHSTESDATSLDSDSSQPIICLVLQEPPETTILLADIFSPVSATWNPFLTFVFDKNDRLCVKAVTEPDSAKSTEITDRALAESSEYNGKLRFSDTGI